MFSSGWLVVLLYRHERHDLAAAFGWALRDELSYFLADALNVWCVLFARYVHGLNVGLSVCNLPDDSVYSVEMMNEWDHECP